MPREASRKKEKALRNMVLILVFLDPQRCNRQFNKEKKPCKKNIDA